MTSISKVIVIIPARGGSIRVPGKNLLELAGHPLLAHSIMHAKQAHRVDEVYVSSDDSTILEVASRYGATPVERPQTLSDEEATSESALLHVLDTRKEQGEEDPDLVVFLQCTSPVRSPGDIDQAIATLEQEKADSLFSACRNVRLFWKGNGKTVEPINYNFRSRKREQEMEIQYNENGSIYVFSPEILRKENNRLGGNIAVYEMDEWSSFQIDTPEHVDIVRWMLRHTHVELPQVIDLIVFDFDGVMTDNKVYVSADGTEAVRCDRSDGWGIARVQDINIPMVILSTEKNVVVSKRAEKLSLPCFYGISDKLSFLKKYCTDEGIDINNVLYLGNDVNDLPCMEHVGFPVAVSDAHPDIMTVAKLVLSQSGGHGAVRELCDRILYSRKQT